LLNKFLRWPSGAKTELPGGQVHFGNLRRVTPVTRSFGFERGQPVDRYYIERFLAQYQVDICGRVLEIGDNHYTCRFSGAAVRQSDILSLTPDNPNATFIGDLTDAAHIPSATFDCIIFTQTLQFIYDVRAAVQTLQRILKPGGVILGTFPALSQICRYDMDRWGDYWRFTSASIRRLFGDAFGPEAITIEAYGNVLAAIAFLQGLSAHELKADELDFVDPDYQLLITVRAVKVRSARA